MDLFKISKTETDPQISNLVRILHQKFIDLAIIKRVLTNLILSLDICITILEINI